MYIPLRANFSLISSPSAFDSYSPQFIGLAKDTPLKTMTNGVQNTENWFMSIGTNMNHYGSPIPGVGLLE